MATRDQVSLPLSEYSRSVGDVIPFPMVKRVGKIRRTAEVLSGRRGKSADHYWQQVAGGLRSQMEKAGLTENVIEVELRAFFNAVQAELVRLSCRQRGPDGAA